MMDNKKTYNPWFSSCLCTILLKISSLYKISFIIGSSFAFFTFAPMIVPVAGMLGGITASLILFSIGIVSRYFWFSSWSLHLLAYHVPGLFSSLYWCKNSWVIRVLPVIACMIAFIAHPEGAQAALYALLWFIPLISFYAYPESRFMTALGSTFTAHAIGSVIWIYTVPMTADQWLLLIPVALVERCCYAVGMLVCYEVICSIFEQIKQFSFKKLPTELSSK